MISIDTEHINRIVIGKNKDVDWVEVSCIGHLIKSGKDIEFRPNYCDPTPIKEIKFDVDRNRWVIFKKNSVWGFYEGNNIYDIRLELLEHK